MDGRTSRRIPRSKSDRKGISLHGILYLTKGMRHEKAKNTSLLVMIFKAHSPDK